MNYKQAMEYVEALQQGGSVYGLENMRRLCGFLDNPQNKLKFVHIAGTNGKGSVLAYVSTILQTAGYHTGRYLSPTIFDYRERFQINGKWISQAAFCRYLEQVKEAAERMEAEGMSHPTLFELETAIAFLYFVDKKCDIVVLETGLGGSLDATNIIQTTLCAVFASVSMDHMAILGNTIEEIARQKAGIIKDNCCVVSCRQNPEAMHVIEQTAAAHKCRLTVAEAEQASKIRYGLLKQRFDYGQYRDLEICLAGCHQIENAVLAVEVIEELRKEGFAVSEAQLRKGLAETKWAGRFSVAGKNPLFIVDGAHNEDAALRLAQSIQFYFTNKRIIYIIGMLRDKEYDKVLRLTAPYAEHIITVTPPNQVRALRGYELAQSAKVFHKSVTVADSLQEAVEMAWLLAGKEKNTIVIAFGSLSIAGGIMNLVEHRDTIRRDSHGKSEEN